MQRCNVYDVILIVLRGGYVVKKFYGNRSAVRLFLKDDIHSYGQLVGLVSDTVFDNLCKSGFLQFERRATDKSDFIYDFYGFNFKEREKYAN